MADRSATSRHPYRRLLGTNRDFRRLWTAQLISLGGDWFNVVALTGLALRFTGSTFYGGAILAASFIPQFLATPLTGVIADRFARRRLMLGANLAGAALAVTMLAVRSSGTLWLGLAAMAGLAVTGAVFDPASRAGLPNAVDGDDLAAANVLMGSTWGIMAAVGAGVGGIVAALIGRDAAFVVNAVSFLVSAGLILGVRVDLGPARADLGPARAGRSVGPARVDLGPARADLGPARAGRSVGPARVDLGPARADLGPARAGRSVGPARVDLGPARADLGPARADLGPARAGRSVGPARVDLGPARADLGPAGADLGLAGADLGLAGADLGPGGADLGPGGADLGPGGADLGPGGADLGPAGADLGPAGADLGPAGADLGPAGAGRSVGRLDVAGDLREAIDWARSEPRAMALLGQKAGYGLGTGMIGLLPFFAAKVFGASDAGIGILYAARGLGTLIGPFIARPFVRAGTHRLFPALTASMVLYGLAYLAFPSVPGIWVAAAVVVIAHLGGGTQNTLTSYGLQQLAPDGVRGRILAFELGLITASMAASLLIAGWAAELVAPQVVVEVLAVVMLGFSVAWGTATRRLWRARQPNKAIPAEIMLTSFAGRAQRSLIGVKRGG